MCEYDALPDIGHACGHNLIAECAVAAGIAVKRVLQENSSLAGKVRALHEILLPCVYLCSFFSLLVNYRGKKI